MQAYQYSPSVTGETMAKLIADEEVPEKSEDMIKRIQELKADRITITSPAKKILLDMQIKKLEKQI